MDAIENSLINACKNHFGKADNIKVIMDKETCDYTLIQEKTVVEEVEDKVEQISLADAKMIDPSYEIGDIVQIPVESKSFGRIATQNAKNLILQKIREEERKVVYDQYFEKEKDIVTGVVQRYIGKNVSCLLYTSIFSGFFFHPPRLFRHLWLFPSSRIALRPRKRLFIGIVDPLEFLRVFFRVELPGLRRIRPLYRFLFRCWFNPKYRKTVHHCCLLHSSYR